MMTVSTKSDKAGASVYVKLFASILDSSLWVCDYPTRILFITMLAMADREGYVYGSRSGLARRAMIDPDEVDDALKTLTSPDADSSDELRNPDNEGRRVEQASGGWHILNYRYYRDLRDADERREQNRVAQRKKRSASVSTGQHPSAASAEVSLSESESESAPEEESVKPSRPKRTARTFTVDSPEMKAATYLFARIRANNAAAKVPNWQTWARDFDLIFRIDKRDQANVTAIIDFAQSDPFWLQNVLSPAALRKQYDRLWLKAKDIQPKQSGSGIAMAPLRTE